MRIGILGDGGTADPTDLANLASSWIISVDASIILTGSEQHQKYGRIPTGVFPVPRLPLGAVARLS